MVKKKTYKVNSRKSSRKTRREDLLAQKIVISIICVAIIAVVAAVLCRFLLNDEKIAKERMDSVAAEYYEGYIYENLIHGAMSQTEIEKAMEKYTSRGFAPVYLRQLLLSSEETDTDKTVRKHCDENTTSVKFYPEAPYDKKSYRIEFQYDCDFN